MSEAVSIWTTTNNEVALGETVFQWILTRPVDQCGWYQGLGKKLSLLLEIRGNYPNWLTSSYTNARASLMAEIRGGQPFSVHGGAEKADYKLYDYIHL